MVEGNPVGYGVVCEGGVEHCINGANDGGIEGVED
jgi:hypothetical protein